jgi:hypothetical protein
MEERNRIRNDPGATSIKYNRSYVKECDIMFLKEALEAVKTETMSVYAEFSYVKHDFFTHFIFIEQFTFNTTAILDMSMEALLITIDMIYIKVFYTSREASASLALAFINKIKQKGIWCGIGCKQVLGTNAPGLVE